MSILASIGSALAGAGAGSSFDLLGNVVNSWAGNSAKESLNKNITKTNLKYQKEYDLWTQEKDKEYEEWWQNYLFNLQNNQYYNLAEKYATHTARWAVEGLKAAGLNPVLAAIDGNLSSNLGNASPQQSGHRTGGGSVRGANVSTSSRGLDLSALSRNIQSHSAAEQSRASAELATTQADLTKTTMPAVVDKAVTDADLARTQLVNQRSTLRQIQANTAESDARADLTRAQAIKTTVDAANAAKNSGLGGVAGFVTRLTHEIGSAFGDDDPNVRALDRNVSTRFGVDDIQHSARDLGSVKVESTPITPWYHSVIDKFRRSHR